MLTHTHAWRRYRSKDTIRAAFFLHVTFPKIKAYAKSHITRKVGCCGTNNGEASPHCSKKTIISTWLTCKNIKSIVGSKRLISFGVVWGRSPKQTLRTPCLTGCGAEPHKSILRRKAYWPLWNPTIYRRFRRFDGCCLRAFLLYSRVSKNDERKRILSLHLWRDRTAGALVRSKSPSPLERGI